jgi:hypothetical protein
VTTNAPAPDALLAEFDQAWRGGAPVFACCRRAVGIALERADIGSLVHEDATTRVTALRDAVDAELPGHLEGHRCCVGHLADVAFDLTDVLAEASA